MSEQPSAGQLFRGYPAPETPWPNYTLKYEPRRGSSSRSRPSPLQLHPRSMSAGNAPPSTPTRILHRREMSTSGIRSAPFVRPTAVADSVSMPALERVASKPDIPPPPLLKKAPGSSEDISMSPHKNSVAETQTQDSAGSRTPSVLSIDEENTNLSVRLHPHSFASKIALGLEGIGAESSPDRAPDIIPNAPFQPKGILRDRTSEFLRLREENRKSVELEEQRLGRRLEKIALLYADPEKFGGPTDDTPYGILTFFQSAQSLKKQRFRSMVSSHEQTIVKWQEDRAVSNCSICKTPFSLAVSRHHCRLCGRIVCSSPRLPPILQADVTVRDEPCSTLCNADPRTMTIQELPPCAPQSGPQLSAYEEQELHAFRACADCRATLVRMQYHGEKDKQTPLTRLYAALVSVQKKIEEALPDLQEMMMGLQNRKKEGAYTTGDTELEEDTVQARKNLLQWFSQYDSMAKTICNLKHETPTENQVQRAIFARAILFLQKNVRKAC